MSQGSKCNNEEFRLYILTVCLLTAFVFALNRLVCDAFDVLSNHCLSVDQDKVCIIKN